MKKGLIISSILGFFMGFGAFGQELLPTFYDTTSFHHQLKMDGMFFQHGTSLKNDFSRKWLFGGEIDDELSRKTFENQKKINRIGGGYFINLEYRASKSIFKKNTDWSWMVAIADNAHANGAYGGDLFGLAFLGNASFLGENVNLSGTSANFGRFLSIGGGLHNVKTKSYVTLHAILPENYFDLYVDKGNISFSEMGDQITLNGVAEITQANSKNYFKGLGAAVDFGFNIPFGAPDKFNGIVNVTGRNIGFYTMHNAKVTTIDTEIDFSGFSIDEIVNDGMDNLLDSLHLDNDTKSRTKLLPGYFQVGKIASINSPKKLQSFFGVRMYTNSVYKPMVYAGLHYQPIQQFSVGLQGAFGGYGNFRLGLYMTYNRENLLLSLGTEDILGVILKSQYGHSALIKAIWRF